MGNGEQLIDNGKQGMGMGNGMEWGIEWEWVGLLVCWSKSGVYSIYQRRVQMHQHSILSEPTFNHKKSNISSFATQKVAEKTLQQQTRAFPIRFHDVVTIQNLDEFYLLLQPKYLFPTATLLSKCAELTPFSLFLIVPVAESLGSAEVRMGQEFYLLNKESRLYLSAEREIVRGFTGVRFEEQPSQRAIFYLSNDKHKNRADNSVVMSRTMLRLRNKAADLEVRMESQNKEHKDNRASLWLAEGGEQLILSTHNRETIFRDVINNKQVVMITAKIQSQISYISVTKHRGSYYFSEKRQPMGKIEANANFQYFSKNNCEIFYITPEWAQSGFLVNCLWVVDVVSPHPFFPFLAKSNDQITLRHLETGLYLNYEQGKGFYLQSQPAQLTFFNSEKFKSDFSILNAFQPLYYEHPVSLTQCPLPLNLEVVRGEPRLNLFLHCFLNFLDNLTALLSDSSRLSKQQLELQISKYIYMYRLLTRQIQQSLDGGFFYFQLSLKLLQVLSGLLDSQGTAVSHLLKLLMEQMAKFMCVVASSSEMLAAATSKNNKRTKEMISLLFVLYKFSQRYTLSLLMCVSTSEPQLIIAMLADRLIKTEDFKQRVFLLMSINEVIDQARRINLDEQILIKFLKQEHQLELQENNLILRFQDRSYSLQELLQAANQLKASKEDEEGDKEYLVIYLLKVMKLLYEINLMQQLSDQEDKRAGRRLDGNSLVSCLVEQWMLCRNYQAKITILGFIIEIIASLKQEVHFAQQRFVIWTTSEINEWSRLSSLLQIRDVSLDSLFSKNELLRYLIELLQGAWASNADVVLSIKYLTKMVDLGSLLISTSSHDIDFLNQLEEFGLAITTLYDQQEKNPIHFLLIKKLIREYGQTSAMLVRGLKLQMDILLTKLNDFFVLVLTCKKRLYLHPFNSQPQANLRFDHFRPRYAALLLLPQIRAEMPIIGKMLQFYRKEILIEGMGLHKSEGETESMLLVEKVVDGLQGLSIIMESFKMYHGDRSLKQNLIASIKLKIFNIEEAIKWAFTKTAHFQKCSQAMDLPGQLLQFILENYNEYELVYPLAELLYEKINIDSSLFQMIKDQQLFVEMLQDPHANKTAKLVLKWIGKQIQRHPSPPPHTEWGFVLQSIYANIQVQTIGHNLLWFVSLMCELGLKEPESQELLYSKLISRPEMQQMIQSCSNSHTMRQYRQKMVKDGLGKSKLGSLCFQFIVLFRLCEGIEKLEKHLLSLFPLKEIVSFLNESEDFYFMKIFVSYLTVWARKRMDVATENQILLFCLKNLREYSHYDLQAVTYSSKLQDRERDGHKAMTQFSPKEPVSPDKRNSFIVTESHNSAFYWELLLEVPCYCRAEGLLICLQIIIKQVLLRDEQQRTYEIETSLQMVLQVLRDMRRKDIFDTDNMKCIYDQVCLLVNLIELLKQRKSSRSGSESEVNKQAEVEQIFKNITDSQVQYVFFNELSKHMNQSPKKAATQIKRSTSIDRRVSARNLREEDRFLQLQQQMRATSSIHQVTHQTLIFPQKTHSLISPDQRFAQFHDREKQIVQFLLGIRRELAHKPRIALKLEQLLLYYFKRGGTFQRLTFSLAEEINQIRVRVIQYKQEVVDYQITYIRRQPSPDGSVYGKVVPVATSFDLLRLIELEQQQSLTPAAIRCLQEVLHFQSKATDVAKYKQQIIQCFSRIFLNQTELSCLLFDCQTLLNFVSQEGDTKWFQIDEVQLKNIVSSLLYRVSLIEMEASTLQLHMRVVLVLCYALCCICGHFPHWAKEEIRRLILDKMPVNSRMELVRSILQIVIKHERREKGSFSMNVAVSFPYLLFHFQDLVEHMVYNSNMQFYYNVQFIKKVFDFLQLLVSRNSFSSSNALFPLDLIKNIIKLQIKLHNQLVSKGHQSKLDYQEIILLSLSFFHTLSLREGKLISSTLYYQRQFYFDQSFNINELKKVYDFYQQRYEWCIVKLEDKLEVVQAFPVQTKSDIWQEELKRILSQFSEVIVKRQMVINYCLGTTAESQKQEQFMNRLSFLAVVALVISYLCIFTISAYQIFSFSEGLESMSYLINIMLFVHLLMLFFMIFYKCFVLVKVGKLEINLNKEKNSLSYFISFNKNSFLFFLILLGISIYSFTLPGISPLLVFQMGLLGVGRVEFFLNLAKRIARSLTIVVLFIISLIFFLGLTIDARKESGFVIPVFNYAINYDVNYLLVTMRIWSSQLIGDYKACVAAIYYLLLCCMTVAYSIYHFTSFALHQVSSRHRCQLCTLYRGSEQSSDKTIQHVDEVHNILKFVRCFKYVLFKGEKQLSLQQKNLKTILTNKSISVFG